jgi:hypothetical protein
MSNRIVLVRFATDPVARICSGVNPIRIPADAIETEDDAKYFGGGTLVDIPVLEQLINGAALRIDITVSGVSGKTLALFNGEAEDVQGCDVHVGIAYQDEHWQIESVEWLLKLRADTPSIDDKPAQNGRTRSIGLSLGTDFTDRSSANIAYFTDADQQKHSPGDKICDHVASYNAGSSRSFGPSDS